MNEAYTIKITQPVIEIMIIGINHGVDSSVSVFGDIEGGFVGIWDEGDFVPLFDADGDELGDADFVGDPDGELLGDNDFVGDPDGDFVGDSDFVGDPDGDEVGAGLGALHVNVTVFPFSTQSNCLIPGVLELNVQMISFAFLENVIFCGYPAFGH